MAGSAATTAPKAGATVNSEVVSVVPGASVTQAQLDLQNRIQNAYPEGAKIPVAQFMREQHMQLAKAAPDQPARILLNENNLPYISVGQYGVLFNLYFSKGLSAMFIGTRNEDGSLAGDSEYEIEVVKTKTGKDLKQVAGVAVNKSLLEPFTITYSKSADGIVKPKLSLSGEGALVFEQEEW